MVRELSQDEWRMVSGGLPTPVPWMMVRINPDPVPWVKSEPLPNPW